jgi:hypothetical protein
MTERSPRRRHRAARARRVVLGASAAGFAGLVAALAADAPTDTVAAAPVPASQEAAPAPAATPAAPRVVYRIVVRQRAAGGDAASSSAAPPATVATPDPAPAPLPAPAPAPAPQATTHGS